MDLSALIFVALAIAWAVYLIPKALRHHEDSTASRTVEGFSDRMRVLARREPVDSRTATLVVNVARPRPKRETATATPELVGATRVGPDRTSARRAARRRLRVVLVILAALATVTVLAALGIVAWAWVAAPAGLIVAWLVACRLMVKRGRAVVVPTRRLPVVTEEPDVEDAGPPTEEVRAISVDATEPPVSADAAQDPAPVDPDGWDPVPVTLPTYVDKAPAARRSVRTIDLDSTGVWTSGRTTADSALAREADAARGSTRAEAAAADQRRAAGN